MNLQGNYHLHTRKCDQTMNRGIHSITLPSSEEHFPGIYFEGPLSQHRNTALFRKTNKRAHQYYPENF